MFKTLKIKRARNTAGCAIFLLLSTLAADGQDSSILQPEIALSKDSGTFIHDSAADEPHGVQWKSLLEDASLLLAAQHLYRIAEDPSVRKELRGPLFHDYFSAVRNIRGWNDGDPFTVNYLEHPFYGAITNYMFTHRDSAYQATQFGLNKGYWKSRLRATGFTFVYSLQYEIGPFGEASIGNIQLDPQKRGVVDWVITPAIGLVWTIAEDALDRYVIKHIERSTGHRSLIALARGFLNPARSSANIFARRMPFDRDDRSNEPLDPRLHPF